MNEYKAIDLSYFDTAPIRVDESLLIDCPISTVWPIFQDSTAWESFCAEIRKAQWTSEPPVEAGSTRRIRMVVVGCESVVNEVFFNWEPQIYQFAFYMKNGNCHRINAYGELWSLTDMGDNTTTVRVRAAFEMRSKVVGFITRYLPVGSGFKKELQAIDTYLNKQST